MEKLNCPKAEDIIRKALRSDSAAKNPAFNTKSSPKSQSDGSSAADISKSTQDPGINECSLVGDRAVVFSLNNQVGGLVRALRIFQVSHLLRFHTF